MHYDPLVFLPRRKCGNDVLDSGEECDWSDNFRDGCSFDCTCIPPYIPSGHLACTLCGNGKLDQGEKCDGTIGCSKCVCEEGYTNVESGCQRVTVPASTTSSTTSSASIQENQANNSGANVGLLVTGILLASVVSIIVVLVVFLKIKKPELLQSLKNRFRNEKS